MKTKTIAGFILEGLKTTQTEAMDIVTRVNVKLTELGVPSKYRLNKDTNGKLEKLGKFSVDTKDLSNPMGLLLEKLELEVFAKTEGEFADIILEFSYKLFSATSGFQKLKRKFSL